MNEDAALALLGPEARWTLSHAVRRQAARLGSRRFIRFEGGPDLSFADLHTRADRAAQALAALGVRAGDRVFAMLRNRAEHLDLLIGCGRIGAVYVPVNTELKGWSLQHQWHNGEPRVIFVEADLLAAFGSRLSADHDFSR